MNQRFAALSYLAMGSPSLAVSQGPPKPFQSVFPATGPSTTLPVVLLKTAKDSFTHWTTCEAPTAALVSGGALLTENAPFGPTNPWPTPSKFSPGVIVATCGI